MATSEVLFQLAERARINDDDQVLAFARYAQYADQALAGDPHLIGAYQMAGVCLRLLHHNREAMWWLDQARGLAYTDLPEPDRRVRAAGIMRDQAENLSTMGRHNEALELIQLSLRQLGPSTNADQYYASLGFKARILTRLGQVDDALDLFENADMGLVHSGNLYFRLYNLLHYAEALSRAGRRLYGREVAVRCIRLTHRVDPETNRAYGTQAHCRRAWLLLIGGWRLHDLGKTIEKYQRLLAP